MRKKINSLVLLLFCTVIAYSQNQNTSVSIQVKDSTQNLFKKKLVDFVQIRFDLNTNITEFKFNNPAPLRNFNVLPNQSYQSRITAGYKWLTLAYSFAPKIGSINNNEDLKGKSTVFGLDFTLNFNNSQHHFFYKKTDGYYLSNSDTYRYELNLSDLFDKYAKLPNFKSLQIGVDNYYYFNGKKFSSQFARNQSEIQVKSAGSLVSFFGFYYSKIDGSKQDFSFLQFLLDQGNIYPYINKSYYAVAGTGYAYSYILPKNFYVTAMAIPAIGVQFSRLEFPLGYPKKNSTEMTIAGIGELSFGYNGANWFGGVFGNYTGYTSPTATNKLTGSQAYTMIFVGYRFKAPKVLEKVFGYANDKIEKIK
jgi:hypothetical protein